MRYAFSRYTEYQRDQTYRIYLTDELYMRSRNMTHVKKYSELISPEQQPIDERSGDEIAADIIARAGLVVKKK